MPSSLLPLLGQPLLPLAVFVPVRQTLLIGIAVFAAIFVIVVLRLLLRRPRGEHIDPSAVETIEISELADLGPPDAPVSLEYYHVPVRLALLVLAPVGRDGTLPESDQMPELIDQLVPGLMKILPAHQPLFRRWPPQLSSEGFTKAFFSHVKLPGDKGKGTPWCSIAGKFETEDAQYLAGIVCRASARNSLSQIVVDHPGKWLDVLRVRT